MEYFIVIYRVDVDGLNHYGKAAVASKDLHSDWEEVRSKINKGYKTSFPTARKINIEVVKATKVSFNKYFSFAQVANGMYN